MRYTIKRVAEVYQDHSCQFLFVHGPEYVISNNEAWSFCRVILAIPALNLQGWNNLFHLFRENRKQ